MEYAIKGTTRNCYEPVINTLFKIPSFIVRRGKNYRILEEHHIKN